MILATLEVLLFLFLFISAFVIYAVLVRSRTFNLLINGITEVPPETTEEAIDTFRRGKSKLDSHIETSEQEIVRRKNTVAKARRERRS